MKWIPKRQGWLVGRSASVRQASSTLPVVVLLGLGILSFHVAVETSRAAFPGTNGKIFFSSDRDGNFEIYSMNPDGTGQTRLTETPGDEYSPSVSANGRWVAFSHNPNDAQEPGQRIRIEIMRTNGSDRRKVTGSTTSADFSPSFSPDGTTLVFSRETDPANENGRLWTVGVDGRGAADLITISAFREYDPEFTPDGGRIFFSQEVPLSRRIYSIGADGLDPVAVSPADRGRSEQPSTSPDGTRVAYDAYRTPVATATGIEVQNLAGGFTFEAVPPSGQLFPYGPAYSPDGSTIAFTRYDGGDPDSNPQIFRVPADGGQAIDLTGPSSTYNSDPYWAPRVVRPTFRVLGKPPKKTGASRAVFRFRSATAGITLRCRLDRRKARACPIDRKAVFRKLGRGRHRLRVTPVTTDRTARALGLKPSVAGKTRTFGWRVR